MNTVSKELGEVYILAHGIANKKGVVVEHIEDTGYLLSIVKTCNNYPKSLELLKEALDQLESMIEEETFTKRRIKEFLNQIENG